MKTVYIVLTKSKTLLSRYIGAVTQDEFTHASISFNDTIQPMYSFGRKYTYLNLPAGLKTEPFDKGFYKHFNNSGLGVYSLEVSDEGYRKMKDYVDSLFNDDKKWTFNIVGLALAKKGVESHFDHCQFCSQFVSNCLKASGEVELVKDPSLYSPCDLIKLKGVKCIYKGIVKDAVNRHFENVEWQN